MTRDEPAPFLAAPGHHTMLRALLVHSQPLGRDYVRACVEGSRLVNVAEATAYDDALSLVRALRPDLVIAELLPASPEQTGFQLADGLRRAAPGTITVLVGEMGASARPHLDALARASGHDVAGLYGAARGAALERERRQRCHRHLAARTPVVDAGAQRGQRVPRRDEQRGAAGRADDEVAQRAEHGELVSRRTEAGGSRHATALLLLRPERRTEEEQRTVVGTRTAHPEVQTAVALLDRFAELIRTASAAPPAHGEEWVRCLARWVVDATHSGVGEVDAFAKNLRQDLAAVQDGLTLPYSQGQTEGHITRLKALKRQMYG